MIEREPKEKYSDEIDLYELLLVLKKRIKYVIAVFILGIFIGSLVAYLSPNVYQARATLWVDSYLMQSMLENLKSSDLKGDSKFLFMIPLQQEKSPDINNLSLSILNSLEFRKKVLNKVKEVYGNKETLKNLENSINSGKGDALFKAEIDKKTGSINLFSEQSERKFGEEILRLLIEEFEKELDKASQSYSKILSSNKESIGKNKSFILHVIEKPNSIERPVKPKRKLIIAVSAISALFTGVFLVFLVEWWSNVRARRIKVEDSSSARVSE